jgi:hypothetical protein
MYIFHSMICFIYYLKCHCYPYNLSNLDTTPGASIRASVEPVKFSQSVQTFVTSIYILYTHAYIYLYIYIYYVCSR